MREMRGVCGSTQYAGICMATSTLCIYLQSDKAAKALLQNGETPFINHARFTNMWLTICKKGGPLSIIRNSILRIDSKKSDRSGRDTDIHRRVSEILSLVHCGGSS